jgi:hypothetical protein
LCLNRWPGNGSPSSPGCEDGSACPSPVPDDPRHRSCHEQGRSPKGNVIMRDATVGLASRTDQPAGLRKPHPKRRMRIRVESSRPIACTCLHANGFMERAEPGADRAEPAARFLAREGASIQSFPAAPDPCRADARSWHSDITGEP